jgi:hypothetical protein
MPPPGSGVRSTLAGVYSDRERANGLQQAVASALYGEPPQWILALSWFTVEPAGEADVPEGSELSTRDPGKSCYVALPKNAVLNVRLKSAKALSAIRL